MKALFRVSAFGLLVALAVGCSPASAKKVTVEGTVAYQGRPVPSGILRVIGPNGSFATAPVRADGTFTLTDVVPGEVKVGLMEAPQSASSSDGKGGPKATKPVSIPAKYADPEKSGLTYTVDENTRTLNIDLK